MANNKSIQILRGEFTFDPLNAPDTVEILDG